MVKEFEITKEEAYRAGVEITAGKEFDWKGKKVACRSIKFDPRSNLAMSGAWSQTIRYQCVEAQNANN